MVKRFIIGLLFLGLQATIANAANYKPIELLADYNHTKFSPACHDFEKEFRAYTTCFDTKEGDGIAWGIPRFVSYEMKVFPGTLPSGPQRPSPWITEPALVDEGIAPTDETYKYSQAFRNDHPNWYDRGHMCMKQHAWRLGANADWNTHTMLNAIPQRHNFNAGIWLDLENRTAEWADEFGEIWIIAGPVFMNGQPTAWLGEPDKGEMLIGIPDGAFKIIIRKDGDELKVLAFIYPQDGPNYASGPYDHTIYLVSVDKIEQLTGLDFGLPDALEAQKATGTWQ